jgi:hypothetical protein
MDREKRKEAVAKLIKELCDKAPEDNQRIEVKEADRIYMVPRKYIAPYCEYEIWGLNMLSWFVINLKKLGFEASKSTVNRDLNRLQNDEYIKYWNGKINVFSKLMEVDHAI